MIRSAMNRVVVKMDVEQKSKLEFADGTLLYIEKNFNFNLREDRCSYALCMYGEGLKEGCGLLLHHNSSHESNEVFDHDLLTEDEKKDGWKIFSVDADMVFCYNNGEGWEPCKDFLITQRIFKPYLGKMVGIDHQQVKNRMYIVKGFDETDGDKVDLSGKVAVTLPHCDYEVIFHTPDNKEHHLIRSRIREIEALDNGMLRDVKKGKLYVGLNHKDCKTLKEYNHELVVN